MLRCLCTLAADGNPFSRKWMVAKPMKTKMNVEIPIDAEITKNTEIKNNVRIAEMMMKSTKWLLTKPMLGTTWMA